METAGAVDAADVVHRSFEDPRTGLPRFPPVIVIVLVRIGDRKR